MAKAIATVSGVALVPGISKNGRLYTRETIAKAVARAQERIKAGENLDLTWRPEPMTQLTHHAAEDDSTRIVGGVTSMSLDENGAARFSARIADTEHGRTIASLLDTSDGEPPFLRNTSIRGAWLGKVRRVRGPSGDPVETADDLELDGLDYTRKPGVPGAGVDTFAWAKDGATETTERVLITESVQEARVTAITEETTAGTAPAVPDGVREALRAVFGESLSEAETPAVSRRGSGLSDDSGRAYADPGYQKDKKQRYDISSKAKAKAAWSYVNQKDNASQYTGPQLKQVKKRIVAALRKFGVTVAAEGWTIDPAFLVTEAVAEYYGDRGMAGSYSISASNGPTNICVSGYGLDPADLEAILKAACDGACAALASLDPDMDGDIDVPGADAEDTDGDTDDLAARLAAAIRGESAEDLDALVAEARGVPAVTEAAPEDPAPDPAAAPQGKEPAVSEATTQEAAGTAPAAASVPQDVLDAAVARALAAKKEAKRARKAAKAAESAPAAPAAVTETDDERIDRIVGEQVAAKLAGSAPAETEEQRISRLVEEQLAQRLVTERQNLTEQGHGPGRKGLTPGGAVNEHTAPVTGDGLNPSTGLPAEWGDKPLHQMDQDTFDKLTGPMLVGHVLGKKADLLG